jgi:hypothetical protein
MRPLEFVVRVAIRVANIRNPVHRVTWLNTEFQFLKECIVG